MPLLAVELIGSMKVILRSVKYFYAPVWLNALGCVIE